MYKIMIILVLLGSLSFLFAQEPVSMRNVALGNVIDGDWENIYDPIELNFYDQQYFFTNLSDFTQEIHIFDDSVQFLQKSQFVSEYPFGFTFRDPFSKSAKHSFLVRFKDNKLPGLSNGYGENENIQTSYYDTDTDGIFDSKVISTMQSMKYVDMNSRLLLILNNTYQMTDNVLGFRLSYDRNKEKWDTASQSYYPSDFSYLYGFSNGHASGSSSYIETDLLNGTTILEHNEEGSFKTTSCVNSITGLVSFMHPTDFIRTNSELRFDLNVILNAESTDHTTDKYEGRFSSDLYNPIHSDGIYKEDFNNELKEPRNEIFFNTKFRHNLDENSPRLKQSFWECNLGIGGFGGDFSLKSSKTIHSEKTYIDTAAVETQTFDNYDLTQKTNNDGSYLGCHAKFMGRSSIYFSEYVCFGYGLTLDLQTFDRKYDGDYANNIVSYHQMGLLFDELADTKYSSVHTSTYKDEVTQTNLQTILPVGLEFSLPKNDLSDNDAFGLRNFVFRLGSVFIQDMVDIDSRQKDESSVSYSTIEYGNGDVTESHPSNVGNENSSSKTHQTSATKRYTAGIGYNHSDNLSIDLGSYIDANGKDFFIGLMFTVKR